MNEDLVTLDELLQEIKNACKVANVLTLQEVRDLLHKTLTNDNRILVSNTQKKQLVKNMGMYDEIQVGNKNGQVKCWDCNLDLFAEGQKVPSINNQATYSIAMREKGYVNVENNTIISWTDKPLFDSVFDKYGIPFSDKATDPLGYDYLFPD